MEAGGAEERTASPGRPVGKLGGRLMRRFVMRPSLMRRGASNMDLQGKSRSGLWLHRHSQIPTIYLPS